MAPILQYTARSQHSDSDGNLVSPATRQSAVERFRLILSWGGRVVPGRKRPGGRRSRSFIKPLLRLPERIERGRPRGEAEREFVLRLALAYVEVTGRSPPRTAHYNIDIRTTITALAAGRTATSSTG